MNILGCLYQALLMLLSIQMRFPLARFSVLSLLRPPTNSFPSNLHLSKVLFIYSSTYLLVALSIDRWEAVVKPLAFTQNRSRGYYLVAGAWFLACISATPVTLSVTIKEIEGFPQCWITYDVLGWKIYMVYLTCSLLVIPALIIAVCYTHIVYTIWRKGQLVTKQKQVKRNNELGYRLQQKQQQEQQQQQQQQQLREEQDRLQQLPSLQMQQPPNGAQLTLHSTSGGAFELSSDPIRKRESQAKGWCKAGVRRAAQNKVKSKSGNTQTNRTASLIASHTNNFSD